MRCGRDLKFIKTFQLEHIEAEQNQGELVQQWREMSIIFDRFFFFCIFLLTVGTTVTLLLLAPRFSHRQFIDIKK